MFGITLLAEGTLEPRPITTRSRVPGPHVVEPGPYLAPRTVRTRSRVPGPGAPPPPSQDVVRPRTVRTRSVVRGPQITAATPIVVPGPGGYPGPAPAKMTVTGAGTEVTAATCSPTWNDVGTGSVTSFGSPGPDAEVGFELDGVRIFTGYAGDQDEVIADSKEESGLTTTTKVTGLLTDWEDTLVFPDFGGGVTGQPERLGAPIADTRAFDFTMNGSLTDGDGLTSVVTRDPILAALEPVAANRLDLPDGFSDPSAQWMWNTRPGSAGAGWVAFRASTLSCDEDKLYLVEAVCYDYAEIWIDGCLVLTCDTAGEVKRVVTPLGNGFHRCSPRGHNGGGRAGLLLSIREVIGDHLGNSVLQSGRGDWVCFAGKKHAQIRTVGQVLHRLKNEAHGRGAPAGAWTLAFGEFSDTAGRPWIVPDAPYVATIGNTMLSVLRGYAETELDFIAAPSGRVLYAYRKDLGTGANKPVPWMLGVDLNSEGEKRVSRV